jgi:hypothetical protein
LVLLEGSARHCLWWLLLRCAQSLLQTFWSQSCLQSPRDLFPTKMWSVMNDRSRPSPPTLHSLCIFRRGLRKVPACKVHMPAGRSTHTNRTFRLAASTEQATSNTLGNMALMAVGKSQENPTVQLAAYLLPVASLTGDCGYEPGRSGRHHNTFPAFIGLFFALIPSAVSTMPQLPASSRLVAKLIHMVNTASPRYTKICPATVPLDIGT